MAKIADSIPLGGMIAPTDSTDVYPTNDVNYGRGGVHHKASIDERDAITRQRRLEGMLCTVLEDENGQPNMYRLVGGIDNVNWQEVTTKSGGAGALTFKGTITKGTSYEPGDIVYDANGATWMFTNNVATSAWVSPDTTLYTNNAYWSVVAAPATWGNIKGDQTAQADLTSTLTDIKDKLEKLHNTTLYAGMANHSHAAITANTTLLTDRAEELGFVVPSGAGTAPVNSLILRDSDGHDWQYSADTNQWSDKGFGVVGVAADGVLGLVRSSATVGKAVINAEGDVCLFEVSETPASYAALRTSGNLIPGAIYLVKPEGDDEGGIYLTLTGGTDILLATNSTQRLTSELNNNSDVIGASARAAKDLSDRITNVDNSIKPGGTIRTAIDNAIDAKMDKTNITSELNSTSDTVAASAKAAKTLSDSIEEVAGRVLALETATPGTGGTTTLDMAKIITTEDDVIIQCGTSAIN